ncbi:MAG: SpoIIE family protein phosphatase [Bdellovibrionales bacterium]|nr:SpoIIE family protein phosphatase [Bdellovibrionales bacterium]
MQLELTVIAEGEERRERFSRELKGVLSQLDGLEARFRGEREAPGQIVFVDSRRGDLERLLTGIDRKGRAVFLLVGENEPAPEALTRGLADDVLVHPFRALEVLSRLRLYQRLLLWDEVEHLNASVEELVSRFREDLRLAERLQKAHLPVRFPQLKGVQLASRYLAGLKSGGDHFDVVESSPGGSLAFLLTDSSSYGLSSALISVLMRVALKLAGDRPGAVASMVRRIRDEIGLALGDKDSLSMFLGVLSRKDWKLRYLCLGTVSVFHVPRGGQPRPLEALGPALKQGSRLPDVNSEAELMLGAGDRLVLLSDGFQEVVGGQEGVASLMRKLSGREPADLLNEFAFQVKSKLPSTEELPAQDCTGLVMDIESNVLRLA